MRAVLGLTLALALCACRSPQPKTVSIDPALESLVPADTTFAMGADMNSIRTTHVFQKYLTAVNLPQLDEFAKKTNVDPRKDLWQILSCSNGKTGLFLARGKFSNGRDEPRIQMEGVKRFDYKGASLFGNEQTAVLFLNLSTAAAGRTPELRALVDNRNHNSEGLPAALKAKVGALGSGSQIWAVFTGGLAGLNLGVPEESNIGQLLRVFKGIDSGSMGINLRDGFAFAAHLDCRTPGDAKRVRDAIKGVVGLGRLSTPDNQPEMLKLYDAIQVNNDQTKVDIAAQVAPDLEDKFLDLWLKKR